ncbi:MAG: aminotransferase class IV [Acidibacillus sp.]|nr:aminotransferase class IV [Acidibacillus sp.]
MAVTQMEAQSEGIGYARGRFVSLDEPVIPIEDRAHQFGDGVYEVIRVHRGKPFLLDEHLERFERSASVIGIPLERSMSDLRTLIEEAIERIAFIDAQVYVQLSRGIVKREHSFPNVPSHLSLTVRPYHDELWRIVQQRGQRMIIVDDIRWKHCHIKSLNLLPNVWMKQKAKDQGADDAIFVRDGVVTECTSSNLAIVRDGVVVTHPADEFILHGVTRRFMIEHANLLGFEVKEESFSPDALYSADEVFTLGTMSGITPIIHVEGTPISTNGLVDGSITKRLQVLLQEVLTS